MTAVETSALELQYLPLDDLHVSPNNPRLSPGDVSDLVASIREMGVLVPLSVTRRDEGGWWVVAGSRRRLASLEAGLSHVPCLSSVDDATSTYTARGAVLHGLAENDRREPLTVGERAKAYAQLQMDGMKVDEIAKATGVKATDVKKLLAVSRSETATNFAHSEGLSLEEAAAVAEFGDDEDKAKVLVTIALQEGPGAFKHQLSRFRQERTDGRAIAKAQQEWAKKGYTVLIEGDVPPSALSLSQLKDVKPDTHEDCPGRAVQIRMRWWGGSVSERLEATHLCLDWEGNGHSPYNRGSASGDTKNKNADGTLTEAAKAERREVREGNTAWRAAAPVRIEFVKGLLARRKPPAEVLPFVTLMVVARPSYVDQGNDEVLKALTGVVVEDVFEHPYGWGFNTLGVAVTERAGTSADKLTLAMLAQVASAFESTMSEMTWRSEHKTEARWFLFLESVGYELSAIERRVITDAKLG